VGAICLFLAVFTLNISIATADEQASSEREINDAFLSSVSDFVIKQLLITENDYPTKVLTRGEAVNRIVEAFNLKTSKKAYIADCLAHADECFFVFSAMSDFDDISFQPLKLYPDVNENFRYYDSINIASMLGLVHGYLDEEKTPFKPEIVISRIQALKIVLAASDTMRWKEKFELESLPKEISPFADVDADNPGMWWYSRYLNFALKANIIGNEEYFRPNDPVTLEELAQMVDNTIKYKEDSADDTQIYARGDSE